MRIRSFLLAVTGLVALPLLAAESSAPRFDAGVISGLGARNIGSAQMSGRIAAVAAFNEGGKTTVYAGSASGGLWKSSDGTTTFKPVFDQQPVQSIGAIAIDPNDHQSVWVGTGEPWTRNSVSVGNGVYHSRDGGDTWTHLGLTESERIGKIIVDPSDSNTVYVCALGKLWSDSNERGLYQTRDAGKTWTRLLAGGNPSTGCSDLELDPKDPKHLLAALWDFRRQGWTFRSGGESPTAASGSGLYRSRDGGRSWTEINAAANQGFPAKPFGRIAVAIAPSDPKIVYAMVESTRSALYRSSDGGNTWEERDRSQMMVWRPFYFANLVVDPHNAERVFKPNLFLIVSDDGGKSFASASGGAHGDWHDLWINPDNTQHIIGGDDGGLWFSLNGGSLWHKVNNLPVSQFYHVSTDHRDPYQVYGGLQDNTSWVAPSAYPGGISNHRWESFVGGDGFWTFSDPADPNYAYFESQGGTIARINRQTLQQRDIQPKAKKGEKLRFNWNAPIHLSPNEKGTIYIGSQFLHRSRDQGQNWERISPDLTSNDPNKQKQEQTGGVTVDNSAAEMHTTIYSISESPKDGQVIWVGTDDGNVQVTRDGGKHWQNTVSNIKGLPKASWVSSVEASRFDPARAYVTIDRHTFGDLAPHAFVTQDYGKTWTRIVGSEQGVRGYAYVLKEDSVNPGLLFLGTEFGLWISVDGGARWAEFKGGKFPAVSVRDLAVQTRDNDLVIGTHGRGIWIIDDLSPLRALSDQVLSSEVSFLPARPQVQRLDAYGGWAEGDAVFTGANPSSDAIINYYQKSRHLFGKLKLEVLNAEGQVIDTLPASKRPGINRVGWAMRLKPPRVPSGATLSYAAFTNARYLPGRYTVRLSKNGKTYETPLEIGMDRRATYNLDDRKAQFAAALRMRALYERMSALMDRIVGLRDQARSRAQELKASDRQAKRLSALGEQADVLRKKIVATTEGGAITGEERLREHMDQIYSAILGWEGRPGDYQIERIDALEAELGDVERDFEELLSKQAKPLNLALGDAGQPALDLDARVGASGPGGLAAANAALRTFWRQ